MFPNIPKRPNSSHVTPKRIRIAPEDDVGVTDRVEIGDGEIDKIEIGYDVVGFGYR